MPSSVPSSANVTVVATVTGTPSPTLPRVGTSFVKSVCCATGGPRALARVRVRDRGGVLPRAGRTEGLFGRDREAAEESPPADCGPDSPVPDRCAGRDVGGDLRSDAGSAGGGRPRGLLPRVGRRAASDLRRATGSG